MTELPDRLTQAAGPVDEILDVDHLHRRARTRWTHRRVGRIVGGIGAIVVAALVVVVALNAGHHPPVQVLTAAGANVTVTSTIDTSTSTSPPGSMSDPTSDPTTGPTIPTTTLPAPTVSATTGTPQPSPIDISGSFSGQNPVVEPDKGTCAEMAHRFDGTFNLSDGQVWQIHESYCGIITGNQWTGTGTFTFDVDDSNANPASTLTGTFTSQTTLPTTGNPYTLIITAGTGTMAGASGSCNIDNHVNEISLADQIQYGTFTCQIAGTSGTAS